MTVRDRAQGCLLGLACGDALGRPVEFKSADEIATRHGEVTEMLGHGTHRQPPGTITDDTEMALCIAESLVDRRGFDPADVARRFVDWLDSDPFDIGLMTRDSLSRIREGRSWNEAGVDVWESRPEGSNAGNGSVMRCAPHAIAFRHFENELTHVSRLSSAITHADPRCQWGCVFLNRTIANVLRDDDEPLASALKSSYEAPTELTTALKQVYETLDSDSDGPLSESTLSTSGYVVDSLQAGLYYGLSADSIEDAIVDAVRRGGDTDTVGAIAGAVAGARFGVGGIPQRWTDEIEESERLRRTATRLVTVREKIAGKEHVKLDDGGFVFKQRSVDGPTYIPAGRFQGATIGQRPHPAPHRSIGTAYHELTPGTAAMLDWERRAYAVSSGRCDDYVATVTRGEHEQTHSRQTFVPVPQYPFVDSLDELPERDQRRILRDGREASRAFVRAYAAFTRVRHPITETDTQPIGIERMDPIAGATRYIVMAWGNLSNAMLGTDVCSGYDDPEEIDGILDGDLIEGSVARSPARVMEATKVVSEVQSGAAAILDYVTNFRPLAEPSQKQTTLVAVERDNSAEGDDVVENIREGARTTVGELNVLYESLRRVAVRHPEIDYNDWKTLTERQGGV